VGIDSATGGQKNLPETGRAISDDLWGILCVFAEARGEPYDGQIAVANVIRNRTKRRFFSNGTIVSTVCAPHQFSWMNTGDAQRTRCLAASWDDPGFRLAAKAWFESEHRSEVGAATHYHADYVQPYWARVAGMRYVKRIGRHLFYEDVE
jgi:spore germination cell wall hydrolase CwlJ-like protein